MKAIDIISKLNDLNTDELKKVQATCNHILSQRQSDMLPTKSNHDLFHEALRNTLRSHGLKAGPAIHQSGVMKLFTEKFEYVEDFIDQYYPKISKVERISVYLLMNDLIYRHLIRRGIPQSYRTMINHVHKVPELVEESFPGYAASGFLPLITSKHRINV